MSSMRVVHLAVTGLAGAPIRLVRALQRHTDLDVRLIDLERWGIFEQDLVHQENPEASWEIVQKADIVHVHNYLDMSSKVFYPIDFEALQRKGTKFVQHYHGQPKIFARRHGISVDTLLASPIPSLVIAQFQERYYPKARVVPNIIPQNDPLYLPTAGNHEYDILFTPSNMGSAWAARWETKGAPETIASIKRALRKSRGTYMIITKQSHKSSMEAKRKAFIVVDELATGSYHLSGLEGLSLGRPVLSYLDDRTRFVLGEISGSKLCPFINTRLEDSSDTLIYLLQHRDEADEIGRANRLWIEKYWADHELVQHFVSVYNDLLANPELITRQPSLSLDDRMSRFYAITLPDIVHASRKRQQQPYHEKILFHPDMILLRKIVDKVKFTFQKLFRRSTALTHESPAKDVIR